MLADGHAPSGLRDFAPNSERLLRRTVRDREQDRFNICCVSITQPRRCNEDVAAAPFQIVVTDARRSSTFDANKDRSVGGAIVMPSKARRQQGELCPHRRHRPASVDWVGITHSGAMPFI